MAAVVTSWSLPDKRSQEVVLEKAARKITRAQQRNAMARRCHTKRTRQELRKLGIRLTKLKRCHWGGTSRCRISDGHLAWARKEDAIKKEELLDGIYVIRTSEPAERLTAADAVRSYKRLALVEQAFRCLKGIDLLVRPIRHRTPDRVRAHVLLCVLAYYVEWHLRQVWKPLLFEDEELDTDHPRATRCARRGPRSRHAARRRPTPRRAACPCRASQHCWPTWQHAVETRAW